jgi:hypothetical protein
VPYAAEAIAPIVEHDPAFVTRELRRYYDECIIEQRRRTARASAIAKLEGAVATARTEIEAGWVMPWPPHYAPRDRLEQFERGAAELRLALEPCPGRMMSVERMFVRKAMQIATNLQRSRSRCCLRTTTRRPHRPRSRHRRSGRDDASASSRAASLSRVTAIRARIAKCPRGHALTSLTAMITPEGGRVCRTCRAAI